jgi:hypothetical protein
MKISNRPPTGRMIEKLKECREKEINGNGSIPCLPEEMKSSLAGLYKRGLIDTRMDIVHGKKQLCIFVTDAGKNFLAKIEGSAIKTA